MDLDAGTLVLDGRTIEFQLVGTQSELSGTLLWAVADQVNGYPEQLLRDAAAVWAYGNAIPELRVKGVEQRYLRRYDARRAARSDPYARTQSVMVEKTPKYRT